MKISAVFVLLFTGLLVRLAAFAIDMPFAGDVRTFQIWAMYLYNHGFQHFYNSYTFTDYPPVYMYVLWLFGMIQNRMGWELLYRDFNFLVFSPAMISDLATVVALYFVCHNFFDNGKVSAPAFGKPFWIALAYSLNPAIILNSSVWGQVDAIHTMLLFFAMYAVTKSQSLPVYLLYGFAVITKPQSLIVAPIFLYSAFHYFKESGHTLKAALTMFGFAALTFVFMALIALPFTIGFDFMPILQQYTDTLGSYPFASINAYNFYALMGGIWQPISLFMQILSTVAIVGVTLMTFWIMSNRFDISGVFFSAALLFIVTFNFSVQMHERYLFPALLFLLVAGAYTYSQNRHDKRFLALYSMFTLTFFINCLNVLLDTHGMAFLSFGPPPDRVWRPINEAIALVSFVSVCLAVYSLKIGRDVNKWNDL